MASRRNRSRSNRRQGAMSGFLMWMMRGPWWIVTVQGVKTSGETGAADTIEKLERARGIHSR